MSPSHSTKKGARYRYYVSQALLQGRGRKPGSIQRVSAPDVERTVVDALRQSTQTDGSQMRKPTSPMQISCAPISRASRCWSVRWSFD